MVHGMSGRLQAFLHANAFALAVLVIASAAFDVDLAWRTLGAGLLVLAHLGWWARMSSLALASRDPSAARALGIRPLVGIPLYFVVVLAFGAMPAAFAAVMVAMGVALLGVTDTLQRADVLAVLRNLPPISPPPAALDAELRC